MSTTINVADYFGQGLSPDDFIASMTKNKEAFMEWQQKFSWPSEEDREFYESLSFRDDLRCLIIAADWCGDVIRNIPVVFEALKLTEMPVELFIMEQHTELMDAFLTYGGRAIPIVIFADTGGHVLGKWGPRPSYVQEPMTEFKRGNPDRNAPDYEEKIERVREEIARRYGEGTEYQTMIIEEIKEILSSV